MVQDTDTVTMEDQSENVVCRTAPISMTLKVISAPLSSITEGQIE